jgi:hypothetical protein
VKPSTHTGESVGWFIVCDLALRLYQAYEAAEDMTVAFIPFEVLSLTDFLCLSRGRQIQAALTLSSMLSPEILAKRSWRPGVSPLLKYGQRPIPPDAHLAGFWHVSPSK